VEITSSLLDTEYLKLYNIKADHWIFESEEDQKTMYIEPFGKGEITTNLGNNTLKIYENNILQINTYITITYDLITYIYQSTIPETVFVSFYDFNNEYLDFNKFVVYVDYIIDEVLFEDQRLSSNQFFVDEGSYIGFDVYDSFNSSIYQASRLAKTFIDITLNVNELKIKNEKLIPVQYSLKNNDTEITKSGYLFESEILEYNIATGIYIFEYLKEGESEWENFTFSFTSNQIFVLNRSKIVFLVYQNQRGDGLMFTNYKTYINGTLLYERIFYRDAGIDIGIEIKDGYDISIKNQTYTVSGDNYVLVILTLYSLKVMSQQLVFNHVNITRDPAYYSSDYYWSEWIAPSEMIDFRLFAGYYVINITNYEDGGWTEYDYTLNGDDVILIGSNNTIYNVLVNLANVNTTIGNQITNVEINITNQNSNINNTIISIEINLSNVNSTLGTLLTNIGTSITNINTTIVNQVTALGVNLTNINTSISNQILSLSADLTNVNSSIITQILTLGANITNINGSIINQIVALGVDLTNINTSLSNQIISIGVDILNLDTSITNQITSVISNITNVNTTLSTQITSLSSDIININSSIVNQIVSLGVDISNINTSLSNQILSIGVNISNINSSIIDQILLVIADIENLDTVIDEQTIAILADITNVNSTLLNQMVVLGVNITNINATITNQILSLSVDLSNVNTSIYNLLLSVGVNITNIENNIGTLYMFTNNSFINLNNVMNSSFIYMENNIISINQSISTLVIGVSNDIYLINGTISTLITQLETNLLLMNVSIDTALFDLGTTLDIIGSNITSNYILLNNSFTLTNTNINDSKIAIINNLLLINNTISTLVSEVYSAVYLINNSIYTAVVDMGTYLSLVNNTISGNLSIVLKMNDFLTELYKMSMFSDMLDWTNVGLNTTLLTSQIDAWEFINNYNNESIQVMLRYNDLIENLTVSAQNTIEQFLPNTGVEYRLWSEELKEYISDWTDLPENKTVNFGFYSDVVPVVPVPQFVEALQQWALILLFILIVAIIGLLIWYRLKKEEMKKERRTARSQNGYATSITKTPFF
ncbi:hypothetical protein LCGC14_1047190, partial [marine sediment metagenome]